MKIRKFYKQEVNQIQGPKGMLNVLGPKTEIEEKDAQNILETFFKEGQDNPNAQKVKAEAWTHIVKGETVTVEETCLSSKVFTISDKRIAARS